MINNDQQQQYDQYDHLEQHRIKWQDDVDQVDHVFRYERK
jgi:hypothetical protein